MYVKSLQATLQQFLRLLPLTREARGAKLPVCPLKKIYREATVLPGVSVHQEANLTIEALKCQNISLSQEVQKATAIIIYSQHIFIVTLAPYFKISTKHLQKLVTGPGMPLKGRRASVITFLYYRKKLQLWIRVWFPGDNKQCAGMLKAQILDIAHCVFLIQQPQQ